MLLSWVSSGCVRDTVAEILGTKFTDDSYVQACMSTKIGGLGIRRVIDHAAGVVTAKRGF